MNETPQILVIGQNSFIGKEFVSQFPVTAISHNDAALQDQLRTHDIIINFGFHPDLRSGPYDESKDFDKYLAQTISGSSQHLILISTRAVYGPAGDTPFKEDMPLHPQTAYAKNKAVIETACQELLKDRLLTLRLSNIFGFEWPTPAGRKTFTSQLLQSLKETREMTFDISAQSEKDFLPVTDCARIIQSLALKDSHGIYNLASGHSLKLDAVVEAIKNGYGNSKAVFSTPRIDSFYMDVSKLKTQAVALPQAAEILDTFRVIGKNLAQA